MCFGGAQEAQNLLQESYRARDALERERDALARHLTHIAAQARALGSRRGPWGCSQSSRVLQVQSAGVGARRARLPTGPM